MTKKQVKQRKQDRHRDRMAAKRKKQQMRFLMAATIIVLLIIAGGLALYFNHHNNKSADQTFDYKNEPMLGEASAPVKIVEFGDFKCPVCRQFDQTIFPKIREDFVKTGKVSYYFFNFPIIDGSMPAELAAESVFHHHPKSYWKFHEALYANQGDEKKDWATPNFLVKIAKQTVPNLDPQKLKKEIQQQTYQDAVYADKRAGIKAGVNGTPTLFINGKMIDFQTEFDYAKLKKVIDSAYQKAVKKHG
ncbi:MAG TPA: thioredoxin domain-containing protein [Bacillales bacterium]|nr:thioredoxin domain-containing protein [Bacillales bacterium]